MKKIYLSISFTFLIILFCLLISPNVFAASINVTSPNGEEQFNAGDSVNITWQAGQAGSVGIYLIDYSSGSVFNITTSNTASNSGFNNSYLWKIPLSLLAKDTYKIWVWDSITNVNDYSDNFFSIVKICTPNWQATEWSTCVDGRQTRTFTDLNDCKVTTNKPQDQAQDCCSDSDGGEDYYVKGTIKYGSSDVAIDSCKYSNTWVDEYYCGENGDVKSKSEYCPKGCENGACKQALVCTPNWTCGSFGACINGQQSKTCTQSNCPSQDLTKTEKQSCTASQTCVDPDGKDYFKKETMTYKGVSYIDHCDSRYPNYVLEYYCDENGIGKVIWGSCGSGNLCVDGICKTTAPTTTCTPNWTCGSFGACINGQQSKTCTQSNCPSQDLTKTESQACSTPCTDSDVSYDHSNGKDYFTKGTVSYEGANAYLMITNYVYTIEDSCSGTNNIVEHYCEDGAKKSEYYFCSKGCENGACKRSCTPNWQPTVWSAWVNGTRSRTYLDSNNCGDTTDKPKDDIDSTCTDSDNGKDYFVKGTMKYTGGSYIDSCMGGNSAIEYYCDETGVGKTENYSCEFGCVNDVCRRPPTTCEYIEYINYSGRQASIPINRNKDFFAKGTVYYKGDYYTDSCSGNYVVEHYCENTAYKSIYYLCANGCQDGACKQIIPVICTPSWQVDAWSACVNSEQKRAYTDTNDCGIYTSKPRDEIRSCAANNVCSDSDSFDLYTKGTVVLGGETLIGNGASEYSSTTYIDKCEDSITVREYICQDNKVVTGMYPCDNGCENGTCKTTAPTTTCTPNWTCGSFGACINGQQSKTCTQSNCLSQSLNKINTESCGESLECVDSDNGRIYTTKGVTTYQGQTTEDSCYSSTQLIEFSCKNNVLYSEWKTCDNGCENGACKQALVCTPNWTCGSFGACINGQQSKTCTQSNCPSQDLTKTEKQSCTASQTCVDPDGKDYFKKETMTYKGVSYIDHCDSRYPNYVLEYYCDENGTGKVIWGFCGSGNLCVDGVCKTTAPTTTCTPEWTCGSFGACINGQQSKTCTQSNCLSQSLNKINTESCGESLECVDSDNGRN